MPYTEDAQPNELRHARKGASAVPTIRSAHTLSRGSFRGNPNAHHLGRGSGRGGYHATHTQLHRGGATSHAGPSPQSRSQWRGTRTGAHRAQHRSHASKRPRIDYDQDNGNGHRYKVLPNTTHRKGSQHQPEPPPLPQGGPRLQEQTIPRLGEASGIARVTSSRPQYRVEEDPNFIERAKDVIETRKNESMPSFAEIGPTHPSHRTKHPPVHTIPMFESSQETSTSRVATSFAEDRLLDSSILSPASSYKPTFRSGKLRFQLPASRRTHHDDAPECSRSEDRRSPRMWATASESSNSLSDDVLHLARDSPDIVGSPDDRASITPEPVDVVEMRREPRDKPRRLLVLPSSSALSVTMRGSLDLVEQTPLRCTALRTIISEEDRQLVDDACILPRSDGTIVALGRVGDAQQLALLRVHNRQLIDIGAFDRPVQLEKKGGISSVCAMLQQDMFATGGYDHAVHLWTVSEDNFPSATWLSGIKHTSTVQSLLPIRDTSDKLLSGSADCSVSIFDIASERVVNLLKLSNSVYHVHPLISPSCALLELGHRELQFEIRDLRLVPTESVTRFGHPCYKVHGRYTRGAVHGNIFASGGSDKDGCVRLWDLRNTTQVLRTVQCFAGRKAIQVAFMDSQMVACSEDHQLVFVQHMDAP